MPRRSHLSPGHRRAAPAFTMIEMMITIGVIVLLSGLTLSILSSVTESADRRQTQDVLTLLDTSMAEWEIRSDRKLTWGQDGVPEGTKFDIQGKVGWAFLTEEVLVITEVLDRIRRTGPVRDLLATIPPQFIHRYEAGDYPWWIDLPNEKSQMDTRFDGSITILDAWGTPVYATHPGTDFDPDVHSPIYGPDEDGTVRTYNEIIYGVAESRRVCFVSAGPDRDFGLMLAPVGTPERAATEDNIYSYPVKAPN